jgi:hypothetical protein
MNDDKINKILKESKESFLKDWNNSDNLWRNIQRKREQPHGFPYFFLRWQTGALASIVIFIFAGTLIYNFLNSQRLEITPFTLEDYYSAVEVDTERYDTTYAEYEEEDVLDEVFTFYEGLTEKEKDNETKSKYLDDNYHISFNKPNIFV